MPITIKWLGHASFLVKAAGKTLYLDPYEGEYSQSADLILVSHSHSDHCDVSKIRKTRKDDTVIVAPKDCARKIGGSVEKTETGKDMRVGDISIKTVEAYNYKRFRSPGKPFHPKGFGVGFLITTEGKTIYHAGDTDFIPEMKKLGRVDVAILPTGGTYTMDNLEAAEAALTINPEIAISMHRWDTDPEEFREKVEDQTNIKVVILREGQEYQVA